MTQRDVARKAGVSRGLVSLALAGSPLVAEDTKQRIVQAAHELGYTRNLGAAALASNGSPVVGVVLPDLRNPFFESMVDNLQHEADQLGLLPLIATASQDRSREATVLQRFRELRASGIVMVSPAGTPAELCEIGSGVPLVLIGAALAGEGFDSVHVDEPAAATLIVEHLRSRGWNRIIALEVNHHTGHEGVRQRHEALLHASAAAGMPLTPLRMAGDASLADGLGGLLDSHRGERLAIVTHNDLTAVDVLAFLRARGMRPGEDVAVTGFDDSYMASRPEFDITSVSQNSGELARLAMAALRQRANVMAEATMGHTRSDDGVGTGVGPGGREFIVAPALSVRSSS